MISEKDVVYVKINKDDLNSCIDNAKHISLGIEDRKDLHGRDMLERFTNVLMGEVAELMVIKWLKDNGKFAQSAVDKVLNAPDKGHDVNVRTTDDREIFCSVKSSLSVKYNVQQIIKNFKLATKRNELADINIQVYFWLTINPTDKSSSRVTVPSIEQSALIGWFGKKDIDTFTTYKHENREAPESVLENARTMSSLLKLLV